MSRLDLIIFGATGYTGKHAVAEIIRMSDYPALTWGVAGRSKEKLETLMAELAKKTGKDLSTVKMIMAEVNDESSLLAMCARCKVVVNCCGPYALYGEPVVAAAVRSGTHYVDVSGEPQFMETMQLKYDSLAREAGVYVICACGFDSIPADLGVVHMQSQFQGTLNSVEGYISGELAPGLWKDVIQNGVVNYGTWASLVNGLVHRNELRALRKSLYPDKMPVLEPKLCSRLVHRKGGTWCILFPTADASVVHRTQRFVHDHLHQRPVQFKTYLEVGVLGLLVSLLVFPVLWLLTAFEATSSLLLKYPRLFSMLLVSKEGPSEAVTAGTSFQFELRGRGWGASSDPLHSDPDRQMVLRVSGVNPGYGATVVALLLSAITILHEKSNMPTTGGVMTTGIAFRNTNIVSKLDERGVKFTIVE